MRPDAARTDSGSSIESDDFAVSLTHSFHDQDFDGEGSLGYSSSTTQDGITPLTEVSPLPWYTYAQTRKRSSGEEAKEPPLPPLNTIGSPKPSRPGGPARQVSHTYQPNRNPLHKPPHLQASTEARNRSFSASRETTTEKGSECAIQSPRESIYTAAAARAISRLFRQRAIHPKY